MIQLELSAQPPNARFPILALVGPLSTRDTGTLYRLGPGLPHSDNAAFLPDFASPNQPSRLSSYSSAPRKQRHSPSRKKRYHHPSPAPDLQTHSTGIPRLLILSIRTFCATPRDRYTIPYQPVANSAWLILTWGVNPLKTRSAPGTHKAMRQVRRWQRGGKKGSVKKAETGRKSGDVPLGSSVNNQHHLPLQVRLYASAPILPFSLHRTELFLSTWPISGQKKHLRWKDIRNQGLSPSQAISLADRKTPYSRSQQEESHTQTYVQSRDDSGGSGDEPR